MLAGRISPAGRGQPRPEGLGGVRQGARGELARGRAPLDRDRRAVARRRAPPAGTRSGRFRACASARPASRGRSPTSTWRPRFVFYLLFAFGPLLYTAWLSFFDWDGLTVGTWIGLDNYRKVLSDPDIRASFVHSFELIFFYAVLPSLLGLVLASVIAHGRVRGVTFFRAVLFLPQTIATVVVAHRLGVDLRAGRAAQRGAAGDRAGRAHAQLARRLHLGAAALGLVGTWVTFGLCLVLFLAGIQKIPPTLYEAARVDGAGHVREFFAVTLPGLRGELAVALTLTMIMALRTFDLIYVSTNGGPGTSTTVPSVLVYQNAFANGRVGLAAAVAVVLTALIFVVAFGITRLVDRDPAR